jgi:hypothetical protein
MYLYKFQQITGLQITAIVLLSRVFYGGGGNFPPKRTHN